MKYSALYHQLPEAVDFTRRFEAEFWEQFGPVPLLRVDEYLVSEWGREWDQVERPVEALLAWLGSRDGHWHLLTPDMSTP
jgi:hypothetical protein